MIRCLQKNTRSISQVSFSLQEQATQGNEFRNNTIASRWDLQYYNPTYGANLVGEGSEEKWDIIFLHGSVELYIQ